MIEEVDGSWKAILVLWHHGIMYGIRYDGVDVRKKGGKEAVVSDDRGPVQSLTVGRG